MKRYLITTADERSWKFDRPVLFLGEWCRRYGRKHIWSDMDAVTAAPYGLELGQKLGDIDYVLKLTSQILAELTPVLNKFHHTQHSERYWNIVLGHWLQRYISVAFNRYYTLDQAVRNHEISGSMALNFKGYSLAMPNSRSFIFACDDDQWNHVFFAKLMAYRGDIELSKGLVAQEWSDIEPGKNRNIGRQRVTLKSILRNMVQTIGPKFAKSGDAFIINSYLSRQNEFKLQLAFGQMPQFWRSPSFERRLPDMGFRSSLGLNYGQFEGFENYVRWQLPEIIPTCYVEGYKNLVKTTETLPWPNNPRFIFTALNFSVDEVFKVWAASKVERGVPYFTGQHGSAYGAHIYYGNHVLPEISASDGFLSWGWTKANSNVIPAFNFKIASAKIGKCNPEGGVLLIELHVPDRITPWDNYAEYSIYQEEQFRFVTALPSPIQHDLTVRLHSAHKLLSWSDEERWKDYNAHVQIADADISVQELISQSRLIVFSYDSTGILENLALNIPTMCFWHGGLTHLLSEAKPYYELLRDAGILLDSPERAAEMIALNWDDISGWWLSQKVQSARGAFCRHYSVYEGRPIRTLKSLLIQCSMKVANDTLN